MKINFKICTATEALQFFIDDGNDVQHSAALAIVSMYQAKRKESEWIVLGEFIN